MSAHFPQQVARYPGPPGPGQGPPPPGHGQPPRHMTHVPPPMSSNGPEKPQRQFSYELDDIRAGMGPGPAAGQGGPTGGQRQSQQESGRVSVTRVRFQDPQPEVSNC